jgi:hypothetical protein
VAAALKAAGIEVSDGVNVVAMSRQGGGASDPAADAYREGAAYRNQQLAARGMKTQTPEEIEAEVQRHLAQTDLGRRALALRQ